MKTLKLKFRVLICVIFFFSLSSSALVMARGRAADEQSVSVYSHRHFEADRQLHDQFTEETGIRVDLVTAGADELIERLNAEGARSPADLLITVDAGRLNRAASEGLLQRVSSSYLEGRIPEHPHDSRGLWYGLTKRARIIATSIDRVSDGATQTYEELVEPKG